MKKVMFVLVAVIAMSAAASAQVSSPVSLYVGGLVSIPNSPDNFSEAYKTGFHGTVGVGFNVSPKMQLVGKIELHSFAVDFDSDPLLAAENISGGTNNLLMFGGDARYSLSMPASPIKPYLLGGIGLARISASDYEGTSALVTGLNDFNMEALTKFYYNIGAGVDLASTPMFGLFAQVRYVSIATEDEASSFIPITLGLKFF